MDVRKKVNLLERNIITEQRAIRNQKALAVGVVIVAVLAAGFVHLLAGPAISENYKWILTLAGTMISGAAGFPLKDVPKQQNKISALAYLRDEYETLQQSPNPPYPGYVEDLEKRFWTVFDKNF